MQARVGELQFGLDAQLAHEQGVRRRVDRYPNSARLPIPALPRTAKDRRSPRRTSRSMASSSAHSRSRPRRLGTAWPAAERCSMDEPIRSNTPGSTREGTPRPSQSAASSARPLAALAVHLMINTAITGATYDIDGGQQFVG